MNGVDVLVFTAGVGENASVLRERLLEQLTFLGIELDKEANLVRSKDPRFISTSNSKVKVLVVPTNEELVIARDTHRLVLESN
ncbi:Acetate kinase [compost metagenome]